MSKAKLSATEWELVKDAPNWVNAALAAADGRVSFFTKRLENKALNKAVSSFSTANSLIKDIIADDSDPADKIKGSSQADAEKALSQIAGIVEQKLGAGDLVALRAFLMKVGNAVASSARDELIGSDKMISEEEAAALRGIEKALTGTSAQSQPSTTSTAPRPTGGQASVSSAKPEAQQGGPESMPATATTAAPVYKEFIAEHTVVPGDNLSFISEKYYGTQANFRILYEANRDVIGENMNLIRPGQVLKIPKL